MLTMSLIRAVAACAGAVGAMSEAATNIAASARVIALRVICRSPVGRAIPMARAIEDHDAKIVPDSAAAEIARLNAIAWPGGAVVAGRIKPLLTDGGRFCPVRPEPSGESHACVSRAQHDQAA